MAVVMHANAKYTPKQPTTNHYAPPTSHHCHYTIP